MTMGLYLFAKYFNLYLTWYLLQYFVGVSLVIFVIIFQSEIRKYFEFLGLIGTRQIKVGRLAPKSPLLGEIVQSCVRMAQAKIGALIVIQGNDDIVNFTEGGTALDGVISEDIIQSIFDPHSDGHDGALIIRNNRISKFGTHLPLSTNFKEIGKHGTRHSAALGITEVSDAFSIVVSEEKGKISISKEGKLKTLNEFSDLEKELEKYTRAKFSPKPENPFIHIFKHNLWLKGGAILTASLLWFFSVYQAGIIEKAYSIPITFENLPKDTAIENYSPKEIEISVIGRGDKVFEKITPENFQIILDVANLENGVNKIELIRKDITIPLNVSMVSIEPETVLLTAKKYYASQIPIVIKTKGEVAKELELKGIVVTPEFIEMWVPQDTEIPNEIATETIDISTLTESVIVPVKLIIPNDLKPVKGDSVANVALTIEKQQ